MFLNQKTPLFLGGVLVSDCCDSSAGITRIRYAGQALMALLSARQHRAPRAYYFLFEYNGRTMLLSS
jgi:hypothetical protein